MRICIGCLLAVGRANGELGLLVVNVVLMAIVLRLLHISLAFIAFR